MAISYKIIDDQTLLQTGTSADETFRGSPFYAGAYRQNDVIKAGGGSDNLSGGTGNNIFYGQGGDDRIHFGQTGLFYKVGEYDRAFGGTGDDTFSLNWATVVGSRNHYVNGGAGHDDLYLPLVDVGLKVSGGVVTSRFDKATLVTLSNVEELRTSSLDDIIQTNDDLFIIHSGQGNDKVSVPSANAGASRHVVFFYGGAGDDILTGGDGDDYLHDGDDLNNKQATRLPFYDDTDVLAGGAGRDFLTSYSGPDTLKGGGGNDVLTSHLGVDILKGGKGDDLVLFVLQPSPLAPEGQARGQAALAGLKIDGGEDKDEVSFFGTRLSTTGADAGTTDGVKVDLARGFGVELGTGTEGRFEIKRVENLTGTERDDVLLGSSVNNNLHGAPGKDLLKGRDGKDTLEGGAGKDTLIGGAQADRLVGGTGDDKLTGGKGKDTFVFTNTSGHDTITDFESFRETIEVAGAKGQKLSMDDLRILQSDDGTLVSISFKSSITLPGVSTTDIDAGDFLFT